MQGMREEMFGVKKEVVEEVNVKKPRRKAMEKKSVVKKSAVKTPATMMAVKKI